MRLSSDSVLEKCKKTEKVFYSEHEGLYDQINTRLYSMTDLCPGKCHVRVIHGSS